MKFWFVSAAVAAVSLVAGCQSKYEESSPEAVKMKGIPLEARLTEKAKLDSRIEEIQRAAEQIKNIIEMFKQVKKAEAGKNVYTPIDFLLDMSREMHAQLPEPGSDGKLVRRASIKIPVDGISEECRIVDTLLESNTVYDESNGKKAAVGEKLTFSVRTCRSQNQFLAVAEAGWTGSNLEFRLNSSNLDAIFKDLFLKDLGQNSSCKVTQDGDGIIDSISCENFQVTLSASEWAMVKTMAFHNHGDTRFELSADLFENGVKKAMPELKVSSDGNVVFNEGIIQDSQSPAKK